MTVGGDRPAGATRSAEARDGPGHDVDVPGCSQYATVARTSGTGGRRAKGVSVRTAVAKRLLILVLSATALVAPSWTLALNDVGLPIHPSAIASTVVRQSGKGEGTEWAQVVFKAAAPYAAVVRFYRQQTGRHVQISRLESGKLLNTMILYARQPQDQITVNISSTQGSRQTEVEIFRNLINPK